MSCKIDRHGRGGEEGGGHVVGLWVTCHVNVRGVFMGIWKSQEKQSVELLVV